MSANFALRRKIDILRTGCWPIYVTALLIILTLMVGCASVSSKSLPPEIDARHPPDIQVGAKLILLEKRPMGSTSLIDMDGVAHVFLAHGEQLIHIEILGDKIITREFLGIIDTTQARMLDSVEHPRGKLRVLAGNKQYFRDAPDLEWQEIKGNRCSRFVPVSNDLFCAFVINGAVEEISALERKRYTYGFIFPVPFVFWTYEYSSKIVLAQESKDGWIVRAVVEPDAPSNTANDFMVGTDNLGNLHFLHFTSKSSDWIFGGFTPYAGGIETGSSQKSELRYAKLTFDQLLAHSTEAQNQALSQVTDPEKWLTIKGSPLRHPPFMKYVPFTERYTESAKFRPLDSDFSVNKVTGEVNGLIWARDITLDDSDRQLPFFGLDHSLVEVSIRGGQWSPHINIVTAKDFPIRIGGFSPNNLLIKTDSKGNHHVLLESSGTEAGGSRFSMNYLLRDGVNWSAPRTLGSSSLWTHDCSLAVDDSGVAFAAWVNEEGKFIGRWIRPRSIDLE